MKYTITKNPLGIVDFNLDRGEKITAEPTALVYFKGNIRTETKKRRGGLFKTLKSTALGGESFFVNEFISESDGSSLGLTGKVLGDISDIDATDGTEYLLQSGSYVCSTGDITLDTKYQGIKKGMFGTNLFMLKTEGHGYIFINCLGGILKHTLQAGETINVDNYQLVGFSAGCDYDIIRHGNIKTTLLGGETLLIKIAGPGDVFLQTKNALHFANFIHSFMPRRS